MRLKKEIQVFIKDTAQRMFPDAEFYLFGSRLDEEESGGDIDILILSDKKIDNRQLRLFRVGFYKKFGWQKVDLVNFTRTDNSIFKNLILSKAQPI